MTKTILIIIFFLISSSKAHSFYSATWLWQLIEKSDIIVSGKIISLNDDSFEIAIKSKIKGQNKSTSISIQKFQNWSCANRYASYAIDQEGIYFLHLTKQDKFEIIGDANEGELIIVNDKVYIEENGLFPEKQYLNISSNRTFVELLYNTVLTGIKSYMNNQEKIVNEFKSHFSRTVQYQHSFSEKPFMNDFLKIVIYQRVKYNVTTLR